MNSSLPHDPHQSGVPAARTPIRAENSLRESLAARAPTPLLSVARRSHSDTSRKRTAPPCPHGARRTAAMPPPPPEGRLPP
ncbi:hypothetical protein DNK56_01100 [Streptomyces sp. AC1-42W]|nr:hypothetical protein DNK55_30470 [Streptomyces sp. AC1-42T]PZT80884.1 hypothetical protein DNK56_01100 [Streptomyces sp. AC1-42W]